MSGSDRRRRILAGGGSSAFPPESGRLHITGRTLRYENGDIFPWRGYSWFLGMARMLRGENIRPALSAIRGFGANVVRVFGRVSPRKGWPDWPDYEQPELRPDFLDQLRRFWTLCAEAGMRCQYVVETFADDVGAARARIQQALDAAVDFPLVFVDGTNEGREQGIDPECCRGVDRHITLGGSGYAVLDSYVQGDGRTRYAMNDPVWDYFNPHGDRGDEWMRKAKDAVDYRGWDDAYGVFDGIHGPIVFDEPKGGAELPVPGRRTDSPEEYAEFVGTAMLFCLGATYHCDDGVKGLPPTGPVQRRIADAVRQTWQFYPPIAQTSAYGRAGFSDFPLAIQADTECLRAYTGALGDEAYVQVIQGVRPTFDAAPGWQTVRREHEAYHLRRA